MYEIKFKSGKDFLMLIPRIIWDVGKNHSHVLLVTMRSDITPMEDN